MNRIFQSCFVMGSIFMGSVLLSPTTSAATVKPVTKPSIPSTPDTLTVGKFGTIHLYRPTGPVKQVVIFISGDGGWNLGVIGMAQQLQSRGVLVAGVDIRDYFKALNASSDKCAYMGAEFERLSRLIQQHEGLTEYHYPILVGYSSGATLAYAILNQTPKGIFAGGLSLGFCPDLELAKPLCKGEQLRATPRKKGVGVDLLAVTQSNGPWIALQGEQDQVCDANATQSFVTGIKDAHVVMLPKVGHGYGVEKNWMPQFLSAYTALSKTPQSAPAPPPQDLKDLPVVEVAATGKQSNSFALLITGDGGYAGMDQQLATGLSAEGQPVVVLNSLKYFWTVRTPQQVANDVDRIVRFYSAKWQKPKVVLVGYSQGADMMPFILNRLPAATRSQIATTAAIGISNNAVFEFHISNWLTDPVGTPTLPELKKIGGTSFTCIYGADETDSICPQLSPKTTTLIKLPGGHHFNGDYAAIAKAVLSGIKKQ